MATLLSFTIALWGQPAECGLLRPGENEAGEEVPVLGAKGLFPGKRRQSRENSRRFSTGCGRFPRRQWNVKRAARKNRPCRRCGVLPWRWRDTKRATRLGLASTHPAKGLRPFAGTPGALGLKKTRSARFEVEAASSEKGGVLPRCLSGKRKGDEARTRFRPPHKGPSALCRDPGRPPI